MSTTLPNEKEGRYTTAGHRPRLPQLFINPTITKRFDGFQIPLRQRERLRFIAAYLQLLGTRGRFDSGSIIACFCRRLLIRPVKIHSVHLASRLYA